MASRTRKNDSNQDECSCAAQPLNRSFTLIPRDTGVDAFEFAPLHVLRSLFSINSAAVAS